ncbi:hypothetical protein [Streptomyces sp. DSM 118878]
MNAIDAVLSDRDGTLVEDVPDDGCGCRKPEPGMILTAAEHVACDLLSAVRAVSAGSPFPRVLAERDAVHDTAGRVR